MPVGAPTSLPSSSPARLGAPSSLTAVGFGVVWLVFFTALQWSVVRYKVLIVAVLVVAAVALALWQWRGWRVQLTPPAVVLMLAGSALATLAVPLFSYLAPTGLAVATTVLVAGALVSALLLTAHRRGSGGASVPTAAGATAVLAYAACVTTAVISSPRPRIDVWVTLQQAADGMLRGENFYAMTWVGSPGIKDAFTYLPWTEVLLAPGRWLFGDVRWALGFWTLVAVAGVWLLARGVDTQVREAGGSDPRSWVWTASAATALLLLAPGTLTQVDQAWTEPLLLAAVVWWAVLVRRNPWWAVVPLALACASKQHFALLLPILLVWRPFGWLRTAATGALAGLLMAPWFVASPRDFVHDTITLLVSFHPIRFANTIYLLALNTFGVSLPFYVTGLVVAAALGAIAWTVWRRQPSLAETLRWLALMLMVANLVNKQAFYNQFWLVGALVVVSLTMRPDASDRPASPA
jgi:hypothetical protein